MDRRCGEGRSGKRINYRKTDKNIIENWQKTKKRRNSVLYGGKLECGKNNYRILCRISRSFYYLLLKGTHDVGDYEVAVGSPARVIKKLDPEKFE